MKQQVKKNIAQYIRLSDEEFDQFYAQLEVRQLKRKETLLRAGDVCRDAYFIGEGCLRYYNVIDGEEHTGQFFFEDGWYSDYESFLSGAPSDQTIEALEKTTVALLSRRALDQLYTDIPAFERFGRLMAENAFMGLRKRTESLTLLSAEERYMQLVAERPKVIQRVPQHYIASFLGIKPPSLSRIRKRIVSPPIS